MPLAANQTQVAIALATIHTLVATFVTSHTQAAVALAADHRSVAIALVVTRTQAVVGLVAFMGILDPTKAEMVGKAIVALLVGQTNEDDRAQHAQILTNQS